MKIKAQKQNHSYPYTIVTLYNMQRRTEVLLKQINKETNF